MCRTLLRRWYILRWHYRLWIVHYFLRRKLKSFRRSETLCEEVLINWWDALAERSLLFNAVHEFHEASLLLLFFHASLYLSWKQSLLADAGTFDIYYLSGRSLRRLEVANWRRWECRPWRSHSSFGRFLVRYLDLELSVVEAWIQLRYSSLRVGYQCRCFFQLTAVFFLRLDELSYVLL